MSDEIAIKFENVSKTFKLPHEKNSSIKANAINLFKRNKGFEVQHALNNISFEVKKGEFFGIVGRNGSGKSTLLKILSGIYGADSGSVEVHGGLTPFIELGVGFNPELTGRENVFLNGALLGFSREDMKKMYRDIVTFAELERFMDQKLKNYSSGMQVRLAFSIAIRAKSDVLVLDEVLAVGDSDFQQKCYDYFNELKNKGQTVVLVTHDMSAVRRFCERGMLIDKGNIEDIGAPNDIARLYEKINLRNAEKYLENEDKKQTINYKEREGNGSGEILDTKTFNIKTRENQKTFFVDEKIGVRIKFKAHDRLNKPSVSFIFRDSSKNVVFATSNVVKKINTGVLEKNGILTLECVIDNVFTNDKYTITSAIESSDFSIIYDRIEDMASFMVSGHLLPHALVHPYHDFNIQKYSSLGKAGK